MDTEKLYTWEPIDCVMIDVGMIWATATVGGQGGVVSCTAYAYANNVTAILVIGQQKPTYEHIAIVYGDCWGRYDSPSTTCLTVPVTVSVWSCIMGVAHVVANICKARVLASATVEIGQNDIKENMTVPVKFMAMHHVVEFVHKVKMDMIYVWEHRAKTAWAMWQSSKISFRMRADTSMADRRRALGFLNAWLTIPTIKRAGMMYAELRGKIIDMRYDLRAKIGRKLQMRIGYNHVISALETTRTAMLKLVSRPMNGALTLAMTIRTNIMNKKRLLPFVLFITVKGTFERRLAFFRIAVVGTFKNKLSYLRAYFYPVEIPKIMAYLRTSLYWKFENRVKELRASVSKLVERVTRLGAGVQRMTTKKVLGMAVMKLRHKRNMQIALNKKRGEIHNVTALPLSVVYDGLHVTAGVTQPFRNYHTLWVTAYLQSLDGTLARVIFSMGSKTDRDMTVTAVTKEVAMLRLAQWFLHNSQVSNEGYSQEIVYDLGKVPPVGPLPPGGDETWMGGYVDYPFKGMGFTADDTSAGYLSPDAENWVNNAKMFWEKETDVFDGKDDHQ